MGSPNFRTETFSVEQVSKTENLDNIVLIR